MNEEQLLFSLLNQRHALAEQRYAQRQQMKARQAKQVITGTFLGTDSNVSVGGNPMAIVQTPTGGVRAAMISSGDRVNDVVNVAIPTNSQYGYVTGMPAGRRF